MSHTGGSVLDILDREVKLDFKALFKALGKLTLGIVTRNIDEVVKQAIDAAASVGLTTPSGPDRAREHAAALVARGLNRGVAELIGDHAHLFGYDPLVRRADGTPTTAPTVDPDEISVTFELDRDLFEHPERAPFIAGLGHDIIAWLVHRGLADTAAANIAARLGRYYAAALAHEWRVNEAAYPGVAEFLGSAATPIEERQRDWRHYLAALQRRPHEPLFADSFLSTSDEDTTVTVHSLFIEQRSGTEAQFGFGRESADGTDRPLTAARAAALQAAIVGMLNRRYLHSAWSGLDARYPAVEDADEAPPPEIGIPMPALIYPGFVPVVVSSSGASYTGIARLYTDAERYAITAYIVTRLDSDLAMSLMDPAL